MDQVAQRDLKILTAIGERQNVTQRSLAKSLDIALGLTNLYLKRLARKGYIKITTLPPKRLKYLLTPQGIAEKTRLTYEYMSFSLLLYRQTRTHLREAVRPLVENGRRRLALYGSGEAAELAYLTLREFGIQPSALYTDDGTSQFLDIPVRPVRDLSAAEIDGVIVAAFNSLDAHREMLTQNGVPQEKLIFLVNSPVQRAG